MNTWRCLTVVILVLVGGSAYPLSMNTPASENTNRDPNSVVPYEFANNMDWSEQASWHWVVYSYTGDNTTIAAAIPSPYFVATRVRSLSGEDQCPDCLDLGEGTQGPPLIFDGLFNPQLSPAYDNLDNGARYAIGTDETGSPIWTEGSWYLNYSPATDTFFAWTWIPDTALTEATTATVDPLAEEFSYENMGEVAPFLPYGTRVFPLAPGTYHLTQEYGCVRHNHGYADSPGCPRDRPSYHNGVDWGASEGTSIYASASGMVTFASIDPSNASGNSVIRIEHDGENAGYITEYLHWINPFVNVGDYVHSGHPIAEVGSVGYSTGPHLHFSVREVGAGNTIDPLLWLQTSVAPQRVSITTDSALVRNVLRWEPLIRASAGRYGVPVALIAAIITVESGGNPDVISPAGAQGLMQVMPANLERFGIARELWLDPASNIDAGARYLAESLSSGQSIRQAAARYFGHGCDVLGTCTEQYVALVLSWHAYYTALLAGEPLPDVIVPAPDSGPTTAHSPSAWDASSQSPSETDGFEPTAPPDEPGEQPAPEPEPTGEPSVEPTPEPEPTGEPGDENSEEASPPGEMDDSSDEHADEPATEPAPAEEGEEGLTIEETPEGESSDESGEDTPEPFGDDSQSTLQVFGFGDVDAKVEEPEFRIVDESFELDTPDDQEARATQRFKIRNLAKPRVNSIRQLL